MTLNNISKDKQANISRIPLLISLRPSKSILAKSKFFKKNQMSDLATWSKNWSYAQASKRNIKKNLQD